MDSLFPVLVIIAVVISFMIRQIQQRRYIRQLTQKFALGDTRNREQVVREVDTRLTKTTDDGFIDILLKALQDKEASVRALAASILRKNIKASVGSGKNKRPVISSSMQPFVVSAMLTALQDDDVDVRRYAAGTLGKTDVSEILNFLLQALDDEDQVRTHQCDGGLTAVQGYTPYSPSAQGIGRGRSPLCIPGIGTFVPACPYARVRETA